MFPKKTPKNEENLDEEGEVTTGKYSMLAMIVTTILAIILGGGLYEQVMESQQQQNQAQETVAGESI